MINKNLYAIYNPITELWFDFDDGWVNNFDGGCLSGNRDYVDYLIMITLKGDNGCVLKTFSLSQID